MLWEAVWKGLGVVALALIGVGAGRLMAHIQHLRDQTQHLNEQVAHAHRQFTMAVHEAIEPYNPLSDPLSHESELAEWDRRFARLAGVPERPMCPPNQTVCH